MIVSTGARPRIRTTRQAQSGSFRSVIVPAILITFLPLNPVSDAGDDGVATTLTEPNWQVPGGETDWSFIVVHHSGTRSGSVSSIHRNHRSRKDAYGQPWLGIGYHFVIGNGNGQADGLIKATFRWEQQIHGAHSGNAVYNARGVGICLIGNFQDSKPSPRQMESLTQLIRTISKRHNIPADRIIGHSDIKATACPGRHLLLDDVRRTVNKR